MEFHEDQAPSALQEGTTPASSKSLNPAAWRWIEVGLSGVLGVMGLFGVQAGHCQLLGTEWHCHSPPSALGRGTDTAG